MRKKILIFFGTVSLFLLPVAALAQFPEAEMSNCCELKHTISNGTTYNQGMVVGEPADGAACNSKGASLIISVGGSTPDWGGVCTMDTVYTVTDFIFWIFFSIAIIMGIVTGFMFLTAGDNPAQMERARSMFTYIVIGIVVAVAVKLIPSLARAIIGV